MYTQLEQRGMSEPPVNVGTFAKMKSDGEAIACLTAYDASYALPRPPISFQQIQRISGGRHFFNPAAVALA